MKIIKIFVNFLTLLHNIKPKTITNAHGYGIIVDLNQCVLKSFLRIVEILTVSSAMEARKASSASPFLTITPKVLVNIHTKRGYSF